MREAEEASTEVEEVKREIKRENLVYDSLQRDLDLKRKEIEDLEFSRLAQQADFDSITAEYKGRLEDLEDTRLRADD